MFVHVLSAEALSILLITSIDPLRVSHLQGPQLASSTISKPSLKSVSAVKQTDRHEHHLVWADKARTTLGHR